VEGRGKTRERQQREKLQKMLIFHQFIFFVGAFLLACLPMPPAILFGTAGVQGLHGNYADVARI
jgi:hypothetical protein